MTEIPSWKSGIIYVLGDIIAFETVKYQCTQTHTSVDFKADFLSNNFWKKDNLLEVRPWSALHLYDVGEEVIYGYITYECLVRHQASQAFKVDLLATSGTQSYWQAVPIRSKLVPDWVTETEYLATYLDAADNALINFVDLPTVELSRIRNLGIDSEEKILKETAKMLGFDLEQYSSMRPNPFINYVPYLAQYRGESGTRAFVDFLSFILQVVTSKPWSLCQLYTKDYKTFWRPEDIPGNNGQSVIDPESPLLYVNNPGVAWRCIKFNAGMTPDLGELWTPVTPQTSEILVKDGVISENYGISLIEAYNISVENNVMNLYGGTDSWIKLSPDQFNGARDFNLSVGFCVTSMSQEAGAISTVFHLGHQDFSAYNSFIFYINPDGSGTVNYRGVAYLPFAPNTFVIGVYYELEIKRTQGVFTFNLTNKRIEGVSHTDIEPLKVSAAVLGQEADSYYGGFAAKQAFVGYISYFRFSRVDGKPAVRGNWIPSVYYYPNDIVTYGGGPGWYATSRVEFTYADLTNKGGIDLGPAITKIFYDFAPGNMVLQVNRPDTTGLLEGFPLFVEIGPERSEIEEAIPIEYLCPSTGVNTSDRKIVQFR